MLVGWNPSRRRKMSACRGSALAPKPLRFVGEHGRKRSRSGQKRRGYFVAPIFAKRDVDDVGKSIAIEDRADSISDVEHEDPQSAVSLIRAGAASVRCLANAADRRQRAINQPNDLAKFDSVRRAGERVAAKFSAPARHVSSRLQLRENLFEKFNGEFLL